MQSCPSTKPRVGALPPLAGPLLPRPVHHGDAVLDSMLAARADNFLVYMVGGAVMHAAAGWLVMRHHPRYGFCSECEDPFAKRRRGVNPFDGLVSGIKGP